jgi:hypothetical protein
VETPHGYVFWITELEVTAVEEGDVTAFLKDCRPKKSVGCGVPT